MLTKKFSLLIKIENFNDLLGDRAIWLGIANIFQIKEEMDVLREKL